MMCYAVLLAVPPYIHGTHSTKHSSSFGVLMGCVQHCVLYVVSPDVSDVRICDAMMIKFSFAVHRQPTLYDIKHTHTDPKPSATLTHTHWRNPSRYERKLNTQHWGIRRGYSKLDFAETRRTTARWVNTTTQVHQPNRPTLVPCRPLLVAPSAKSHTQRISTEHVRIPIFVRNQFLTIHTTTFNLTSSAPIDVYNHTTKKVFEQIAASTSSREHNPVRSNHCAYWLTEREIRHTKHSNHHHIITIRRNCAHGGLLQNLY